MPSRELTPNYNAIIVAARTKDTMEGDNTKGSNESECNAEADQQREILELELRLRELKRLATPTNKRDTKTYPPK